MLYVEKFLEKLFVGRKYCTLEANLGFCEEVVKEASPPPELICDSLLRLILLNTNYEAHCHAGTKGDPHLDVHLVKESL